MSLAAMSLATIFLVLCFVGFIVGMIAIAWWSEQVHVRQIAEHDERMRKTYAEHNERMREIYEVQR